MKKVEEESVFVGVKSPVEIRRALLEASRGIVESLQRYEKFKSIRENRLTLINKLKGDIKEISTLIYRLRAELPTVNLKPEPIKKGIVTEKAQKRETAKKNAEAKTKHKTELDRLESELDDIERKLNSIS